jgi:hypothetical protein
MSKEIKKVRVKIKAACHVDGVVVQSGDIVLLPEKTESGEPFAVLFGEIQKDAPPAEKIGGDK